MSQSLYTAMSGINAANTDLEVISNNVANINTTAFKSSSVNFSDVYSTTISYGSVSSGNNGGTNPIQIGVGTQVSAISKDFSTGSANSTGNSNDLMIQGTGFFTVTDGEQVYYTRDGDFSWDEKGNLVTASGFKVLGTDNILSTTTSGNTVYVPTSIIPVVQGNQNLGTTKVADLNGLGTNTQITSGYFIVNDGTTAYNCILKTTDLSSDMDTLVAAINQSLNDAGCTTVTAAITKNASGTGDGTITFTSTSTNDVSFSTSTANITSGGVTYSATNFLKSLELSTTTIEGAATTKTSVSKILDYTADITDVTSAAASTSINDITIGTDGTVQATYADGSTLSVELGTDKTTYGFIYTTANGAQITGSSLGVSKTVAVPSNFVIQLATVTNTNGFISVGNNLYQKGPNSGDVVYTVGGEMGAGKIASGTLEASNVDLSEQLSEMILAQRAIEANSRVFTTVSDTMNTIVNMGR